MATHTLTPEFPCYTGHKQACWQRPYEDLLDRLAAVIGMEHARTAFAVIGDDIVNQTQRQMLSALLKAYGDDLVRYSQPRPQVATHSRIGGN